MLIIYEGIVPDAKGLHYILKTGTRGDIIVMNPDTKKREAIRYASNQPSIYIREQIGPCILPSIVMGEGILKVDSEDEALVKFLEMTPQNGKDFRKLNPERDAKESLADKELILDVTHEIRSKSKEEYGDVTLSSLLLIKSKELSYEQIEEMGPHQVRKRLYSMAENEPSLFINSKGKITCFDDSSFIRKDLIIRAISEKLIKVSLSGRLVSWENGEEIVSVPEGKDYLDHLANHFLSREGGKTMNAIGTELEKLYK